MSHVSRHDTYAGRPLPDHRLMWAVAYASMSRFERLRLTASPRYASATDAVIKNSIVHWRRPHASM